MGKTALVLVNTVIRSKLNLTVQVQSLTAGVLPAIANRVLRALNEIKDELLDDYDWKALKKKGSFALVANQPYFDLAADFHRFVDSKRAAMYYAYNPSANGLPTLEVVDDDTFVDNQAIDVTTGLPYIARLFGINAGTGRRQVELYYAPNAAAVAGNYSTVFYEYIQQWPDAAADADTFPFDDNLMIQGAYMKIRNADGRLEDMDGLDYVAAKNKAILRDSSGRKRSLKYTDL